MKYAYVEREVTTVLDQCRNLYASGNNTKSEAVPISLIETILKETDVKAFMNCISSEVLMIISTQIEPDVELRPSWTACVPGIVDFLRARPDHAVLMYVVGLQDAQSAISNQKDGPDSGDQKPAPMKDLMRSLCMQLMHWLTKEGLEVDWIRNFPESTDS
jgi:hypothetical protein